MSDPRDIITLDEAKRALRITTFANANEQTALETFVTATSRTLDRHFGTTVIRTVTGETHDGINRSGRGLRTRIVLAHRPVLTVSQVVEHRGGESVTLVADSATSQPVDAYLQERYPPDPALGRGVLIRRSGGFDHFWERGRDNIMVDYTAGRFADTASVDARFKRAAEMMLVNFWREREPSVVQTDEFTLPTQAFPGFAVPNAVRAMLAEEADEHEPWGIA